MKFSVIRILPILIGACVVLTGCSQGQPPFRMVQFCLSGPQEIPRFKSFMGSIAGEYQMKFTDRSADAEAELTSISNDKIKVSRPLVNIFADRNGEFNFGASNLDMGAEHIVIGFNGENHNNARQFADVVVRKLSTHWTVHEVPKDRGAIPLDKCD